MERPPTTLLRIGNWCVNPASGQISRDGETVRVEVRTMRVLLCLAEHPGEVVSIEDLLSKVWPGVYVNQDSVYQAVASLRRLLGDDPKLPTYIETVPRLGYRMVANVSPWTDQSSVQAGTRTNAQPNSSPISHKDHLISAFPDVPTSAAPAAPKKSASRLTTSFGWAILAVVCLALVFVFFFRGKLAISGPPLSPAIAPPPQNSIAVLPFLDLTDAMNQEPFADGMTEELIDKLSKIPGLRIPSPTSSFYFKGKQITIGEIARTLGVAYVLDGSVRKSGSRLRVAARLIRVDSGYVVWSETYDRPFDDILMVQDDIAGEVTKALRTSIGTSPPK
jgi:transcriptional activator of cad operon